MWHARHSGGGGRYCVTVLLGPTMAVLICPDCVPDIQSGTDDGAALFDQGAARVTEYYIAWLIRWRFRGGQHALWAFLLP